jgi:hypothetical protein
MRCVFIDYNEDNLFMMKLPQAIVAVMSCTLVGGVAGGIVGATVGRLAPTFVRWLYAPGGAAVNVDPTEFGFGLGVVTGTGIFLVCVLTIRDAWLARSGIVPPKEKGVDPLD